MRNFPVFTTQYGVASLILREIPYRQTAYIKLLGSLEPEKLLEECKDFCRAVGAQHIYASGDACLEKYPLHTVINEMEREWSPVPATRAAAVAVTQQTLAQWKDIYNQRMMGVPNASYMDNAAAKTMLMDGSAYFVELEGRIIGIGKGSGDTIEAIASICPGAGQDIVLALCKELKGNRFRLQVADTNVSALTLYGRLGFVKTKEISRWHQII